eukprot:TRINITY_DN10390_c0_g1_i2.p1 TRINITY_DN10390_c0_g1~~TRINITY_DN10390_c0_g1_i2.p1  ORF type:complete len:664 (+),score=170.34 TRINITY_DN10390_c0_g1_i2:98-2089(+)
MAQPPERRDFQALVRAISVLAQFTKKLACSDPEDVLTVCRMTKRRAQTLRLLVQVSKGGLAINPEADAGRAISRLAAEYRHLDNTHQELARCWEKECVWLDGTKPRDIPPVDIEWQKWYRKDEASWSRLAQDNVRSIGYHWASADGDGRDDYFFLAIYILHGKLQRPNHHCYIKVAFEKEGWIVTERIRGKVFLERMDEMEKKAQATLGRRVDAAATEGRRRTRSDQDDGAPPAKRPRDADAQEHGSNRRNDHAHAVEVLVQLLRTEGRQEVPQSRVAVAITMAGHNQHAYLLYGPSYLDGERLVLWAVKAEEELCRLYEEYALCASTVKAVSLLKPMHVLAVHLMRVYQKLLPSRSIGQDSRTKVKCCWVRMMGTVSQGMCSVLQRMTLEMHQLLLAASRRPSETSAVPVEWTGREETAAAWEVLLARNQDSIYLGAGEGEAPPTWFLNMHIKYQRYPNHNCPIKIAWEEEERRWVLIEKPRGADFNERRERRKKEAQEFFSPSGAAPSASARSATPKRDPTLPVAPTTPPAERRMFHDGNDELDSQSSPPPRTPRAAPARRLSSASMAQEASAARARPRQSMEMREDVDWEREQLSLERGVGASIAAAESQQRLLQQARRKAEDEAAAVQQAQARLGEDWTGGPTDAELERMLLEECGDMP